MDDDVPDWNKDYNPFDAIGIQHITQVPPSQKEFAKIIQYARFVTSPSQLLCNPELALNLPYTHAQVEEAIAYFAGSGNGSLEQGREKPDDVIWAWAFFSVILTECQGVHTRRWAPERLRIKNVLLKNPIVISAVGVEGEITGKAPVEATTTPATSTKPSEGNIPPITNHSQRPAKPDLPSVPSTPPPGRTGPEGNSLAGDNVLNDPPLLAEAVNEESAVGVPLRIRMGVSRSNRVPERHDPTLPSPSPDSQATIQLDTDVTNPPATGPRSSSATTTIGPVNLSNETFADAVVNQTLPPNQHPQAGKVPSQPKKPTTKTAKSNRSGGKKVKALAPGTYNPGVSVFVGFYKGQLHVVPEQHHTQEQDDRVSVFALVDKDSGRVLFTRRLSNMAGARVKVEYRTDNYSGLLKYESIVFAGDFVGLSSTEVRFEVARRTMLPGFKNPQWVPTPKGVVRNEGEDVARASDDRDNSAKPARTDADKSTSGSPHDAQHGRSTNSHTISPTAPTIESLTPPRDTSTCPNLYTSRPEAQMGPSIDDTSILKHESKDMQGWDEEVARLEKRHKQEMLALAQKKRKFQKDGGDESSQHSAKKLKVQHNESGTGLGGI